MSFSLNDFLSQETLKDSHKSERKLAMISADKLHPADGNFYSKEDDRIQKMAASILMLSTPGKIGIQQNLVVRPIPDTDEYTILAGETRWSAVMSLLEKGELDTDKIPCEIEQEDDPIRDEMILILTNSTQRVRSDAEKMHEVKRLRELLEEYKKNHKMDGTIQKAIGDLLGMSKTKVGTLENIDRNLSPELTTDYEKGKINTSVANKLAGLDEDGQLAGKRLLDEKGSITAEDVRTLTEPRDDDGQRPTHKKCITGWSRYGYCNCCGHDGVQCCNQCQESCNVRCGWIDNPYISEETEKKTESPYEMEYKITGDSSNDSEQMEESLHFNMNLPYKQDSSIKTQKSSVSDEWMNSEQIENLKKRLITDSHGCERLAQEMAEKVMGEYKMVSGEPVYPSPDVGSLRIEGDGKTIFLKSFVSDYYKKIIEMVLDEIGQEVV